MDKKKFEEKTANKLQIERVTAVLEEMERTRRVPEALRENPGQFLRDFYEVWHIQGGKEGGRWRNSIRKMRDEWLVGRNAVASLHPKLMGRVKITRADARALIDLFLTRWHYVHTDGAASVTTRDGYVGFETEDRRQLTQILTRALFDNSQNEKRPAITLPLQEDKHKPHADDLRIRTFIETEYRQCDALITFSRDRIAIGPSPAMAMKNFFYLLNAFYEEDKNRLGDKCLLIWIVDLGKRLFEDDQSFREFYNAGFLSLLLQSFLEFDSEQDVAPKHGGELFRQIRVFDPALRQQRLSWLRERSVVIVENLRPDDIGLPSGDEDQNLAQIGLRDIGINAQHILPMEAPPRWASGLKSLVGRKGVISNVAFTTLVRWKGWGNPEDRNFLRHFALARTIRNSDIGTPNTVLESLELPSAGELHDEATRLVYFSALYRLNSGELSQDSEEFTAYAYLRKNLGLNVLTIDQFIGVFQPNFYGGG